MHLTILHAAEPRKIRLGQVVRHARIAAVLDGVIDAARVKFRVLSIVGRALVCADDGTLAHVQIGQLANIGLILGLDHE